MREFAGFSGLTYIPGAGHFCVHASAHTRAHSVSPIVQLQFTKFLSSCSVSVPRGPSMLFYISLWFTQFPTHSIHQTADHHFFHPPPPELTCLNWWNSPLTTTFLKLSRRRLRGSSSMKWLRYSQMLLRTCNLCSQSENNSDGTSAISNVWKYIWNYV
jgi:hypothetical protein